MSVQRPNLHRGSSGGEQGSLSGDLFIDWGTDVEKVSAHFEWAAGNGICGRYNGSCVNADLRTVTQGFQVSELYWSFRQANTVMELGMIDSTRWIDTNALAGDENRSFMGMPFCLDPTMPNPDYAPGGVMQSVDAGWALTLLGVSSLGLIDAKGNPNTVWDGAGRSGNFVALALGSASPVGTTVTYWQDNGHFAAGTGVSRFNEGNRTGMARGVAINTATGTDQEGGFFVRLGWADPRYVKVSAFASVGFVVPSGGGGVTGFGWAGKWLSRNFVDSQATLPAAEKPNAAATEHHVEWFYRVPLSAHTEWTVDLQYLRNPGNDSSPVAPAQRQDWVGGLRLVSML